MLRLKSSSSSSVSLSSLLAAFTIVSLVVVTCAFTGTTTQQHQEQYNNKRSTVGIGIGIGTLSTSSSLSTVVLHVSSSTTITNGSSPATTTTPEVEILFDLFNRQITQEFIASQTYLSASIWFDQNDWEGMASYMKSESDEERVHGLGFVEFANKRNFPIELEAIPAPVPPVKGTWTSPADVWQSILELEQTNTRSLLNLAEAANNCHDYAVLAFLNPYHISQVNEEDKIGGILAKVVDESCTPGLLRSLDLELGGQAGA